MIQPAPVPRRGNVKDFLAPGSVLGRVPIGLLGEKT